jgi:hypothetical protein
VSGATTSLIEHLEHVEYLRDQEKAKQKAQAESVQRRREGGAAMNAPHDVAAEVRQALDVLFRPGHVVELRNRTPRPARGTR